jgi:hypothetical protein
MKKLILGEYGNLAQAVARYYPEAVPISRGEFIDWSRNPNKLAQFFTHLDTSPTDFIIFNCAGITDSETSLDEITFVNSTLPSFLAKESLELNFKLVTFGTVMEQLPKYSQGNRYLNSKLKYFESYVENNDWQSQNIHIQMHTLYGGSHVKPKMFLGQIFNSLKFNLPFKMSGGDQIREYHHVDDIALAIGCLIDRKAVGTLHISNGNPIKLVDLADAIFSYFNSTDLLQISAQSADVNDNRSLIFKKHYELKDIEFRAPIEGVISWLEDLGVQSGGRK